MNRNIVAIRKPSTSFRDRSGIVCYQGAQFRYWFHSHIECCRRGFSISYGEMRLKLMARVARVTHKSKHTYDGKVLAKLKRIC